MILVIMAAGMGSRYGGLKQIDPVGPNGEFIIDYSVYDAVKAGFKKVVFIIKEENYEIFKETIGKRVSKQIEVEYVFQDMKKFTYDYKIPEDRVKPLGTTQAILCCKDVVDSNFAVINADDFYGRDAYEVIANFLKRAKDKDCALVGYEIANTLTENGAVKRGVCFSENGFLTKLIESNCESVGDKVKASPLDGSSEFFIENDTPASMNMLAFTPKIFSYLEDDMKNYLEKNKNDLSKCERVIPDTLFELIKKKELNVEVLTTTSKWYGVTYKEDRPMIVTAINKLIDNKEYPKNLWK